MEMNCEENGRKCCELVLVWLPWFERWAEFKAVSLQPLPEPKEVALSVQMWYSAENFNLSGSHV